MKLPLIAPKHFRDFTPEEFQAHVNSMYEDPAAKRAAKSRSPKKPSCAEGITLSRTKKGALSVRISSKKRALRYVTRKEIEDLAKSLEAPMSEVWNLFRAKDFAIVGSPEEAASKG